MGYTDPDKTGTAAECKITNDVFKLYRSDQIIQFAMPVYYDSIIIEHLGTTDALTKDTDYIVNEEASTEMAQIMASDTTWNSVLVNSIKILNTNNDTGNFQLSYQQLFPDAVSYNYYKGSNIELTPDVILSMMNNISNLQNAWSVAYVAAANFTAASSTTKIAEVDLDDTNANNVITDEAHTINTTSGIVLISPSYGSFYDSNLTVKVKDTGVVLNKGTDYSLQGFNALKTKASTATAGVYDYIKISATIVGDVLITYHAFGGLPALSNFKELSSRVGAMETFLSGNALLTTNGLAKNATILDLTNRLIAQEDKVRLLTDGANYGDVTTNTTSLIKVTAVDNNVNWWTIASLYKVSGATTLIYTDTFNFHMQLMNSNVQLSGNILVDLTKTDVLDQLKIAILNNSSELDKYKIQFRVVYNQTAGSYSGAYLQVGIALQDYLQETIAIEDLSGKESCFVMTPTNQSALSPQNDSILLPDGTSTWSSTNTSSLVIAAPAIMSDGTEILSTDTAITINSNINPGIAAMFTLGSQVLNACRLVDITLGITTTSPNTVYSTTISLPLSKIVNVDSSITLKGNEDFELLDGYTYTLKVTLNSSGIDVRVYNSNNGITLPNVIVHSVKILKD
jgi:hypothetical protein